jgi:hypothetical protein
MARFVNTETRLAGEDGMVVIWAKCRIIDLPWGGNNSYQR